MVLRKERLLVLFFGLFISEFSHAVVTIYALASYDAPEYGRIYVHAMDGTTQVRVQQVDSNGRLYGQPFNIHRGWFDNGSIVFRGHGVVKATRQVQRQPVVQQQLRQQPVQPQTQYPKTTIYKDSSYITQNNQTLSSQFGLPYGTPVVVLGMAGKGPNGVELVKVKTPKGRVLNIERTYFDAGSFLKQGPDRVAVPGPGEIHQPRELRTLLREEVVTPEVPAEPIAVESRPVQPSEPQVQETGIKKHDLNVGVKIPSLVSPEAFEQCVQGTQPIDLGKLYSGMRADCQGEFGTCGGYSTTNLIEMAWWRYNYIYALEHGAGSWSGKPLPFLSELLYYRSQAALFRTGPQMIKDVSGQFKENIAEGTYPQLLLAQMVFLLKNPIEGNRLSDNKVIRESKKPYVGFVRESTANLEKATKLATEMRDRTNAFIERAAEVTSKDDPNFFETPVERMEKDSSGNLVSRTSTLRELIASQIEYYTQDLFSPDDILSIPSHFTERLQSYSIFPRSDSTCDPNKLFRTFKYHLCQGIPLEIRGLESIFPENHSVALMGFGKDKSGQDVLLAKNSHNTNVPVEIPVANLCGEGGVAGASLLHMSGADDKDWGDGVPRGVTPPENLYGKSYYSAERIYVDNDTKQILIEVEGAQKAAAGIRKPGTGLERIHSL
ncbi:MAG: hypothetical protein R3A80_01855 [Bdellovibrionota bacterium]